MARVEVKNTIVNEEQPYIIPSNWVWTKFSNLCKLENGYAFKSTDYKKTGVPLIRISNIVDNNVDLSECVCIKDANMADKFLVTNGDLLIAMSGATTGKNGIYKSDKPAYLNQRVGNIKILDERLISTSFRNYYIMDKNQEILKRAYGGAQPNISGKLIGELLVPLPPLPEQQRIVERIESLFEKLDTAKELAQSALDSFENRKAAILHKAFTGELTAKWREGNGEHENNIISSVLQYYSKNMPARNVKQVVESQQGITVIEEIRYSTWYKCSIGAIAVVTNGSTPSRQQSEYWNGNIPWVSSGEVKNNIITNTKESITQSGYDNSSVKILPKGTVLIAMIGEGKTRGQSAVLDIEATTNQNVAAIDTSHQQVQPRFIWYWLQKQYENNREKGNGTGPQALNCQKVRELEFILPPLKEQEEIVKVLDSLFLKEQQAQELSDVVEKIDLMKKAIIARAFRGELGTNNPEEESAVELLKEVLKEKL